MYAHVNIWRLSSEGATSDDTAAREIAARLRGQPGFRSYSLVRTGEREVVVVTVFESEAQLDAAIRAVADVVRDTVSRLTVGEPERRRGEVLYHTMA